VVILTFIVSPILGCNLTIFVLPNTTKTSTSLPLDFKVKSQNRISYYFLINSIKVSVPKIILSYCNQPIFKVDDSYYTSHANFVDFLCRWTSENISSRLMVPVSKAKAVERCWVRVEIDPSQVLEARPYTTHYGAIISGFLSAFIFRRHVAIFHKRYQDQFSLVLPGANAFGATLSFLVGRNLSSKALLVVRGDSLKTVSHMYAERKLQRYVLWLSRFFVWRLNSFQKRGAKVLCFGDELARRYAIYGRSLSISPLIESLSKFKNDRDRERRQKGRVTMLYIGRLSNEKGLVELIDALNVLVDNGYQFNMVIAGHGPLQELVETSASSVNLRPYLTYVGRLSPGKEVLEMIDQADVFLLPSKTEGVPRVIVESLSRGVPVITTAVGGIEAAFGDSVSYFSGQESAHLMRGIATFLDDPSAIDTIRSDPNSVLEQFTFESNIRKIERFEAAGV